MPVDVIMPALGMAQETGKVLRWLKADGAGVVKGEPLLEVETDKVTVEIEAPADGTLAAVSAGEGDEVPVGSVIALVLAAGEDGAVGPSGRCGCARAEGAAPARVAEGAAARARARRRPRRARRQRPERRGRRRRRRVRTRGGPEHHEETLAVGSVWRVMAERTTRAWQEAPQFVLSRDVDASRLQSWREAARRRPGLERVSITDLLVKICAEALRRHPRVTASWRDGALAAGAVNVGIAVATDDALVVPVVHGADGLTLAAVSERRRALVEAARAGRLRPEDVHGGSFTISNLGMYGVDAFQAIVNSPQAAILAVGRIVEKPVAVAGEVVVRPVLTLTVSFDHRVVDGARGAEFLDTLATLVEEPAGLVE